jgi:hypothetical protein
MFRNYGNCIQSLYVNCAQGWRQTYVEILKLSMGKRCGKRDLGWTCKVCVICPVLFLSNSCKIQGCLEDLLWFQVTLGQLYRGLRNSCTGSKSFLITNLRILDRKEETTKLFSIVCRLLLIYVFEHMVFLHLKFVTGCCDHVLLGSLVCLFVCFCSISIIWSMVSSLLLQSSQNSQWWRSEGWYNTGHKLDVVRASPLRVLKY